MKTRSKMKHWGMRIKPEDYEALRAIADEESKKEGETVSVSDVARHAITEFLKVYKRNNERGQSS